MLTSSNPIWTQLSDCLDGKIAPKSLYISILQNRHGWRSKLRQIYSYAYDSHENESIEKGIETADESNNGTLDEDVTDVSSSSVFEKGRELFELSIQYDVYRTIRPEKVVYKRKNKKRVYEVLKQNAWTDVINDALIESYNFPCNYIYKRVKVYDSNHSKHFISFQAKCKDKSCGANLNGWSDQRPAEGEPLLVTIFTTDTRGMERQHNTKRPLKGRKRIAVGLELEKDLASNWRRNNVNDMEFGRFSPPNLYSLPTLRKAKQESKDKIMGIKYKCPVQSLMEFKHNSSLSGSIHGIGIDPFFVHYWTNYQIAVYKDASKEYTKLSIDATGSLVKKLKRTSLDLLSAHIFLYEGILSTSIGHISITQMLSEKQDTLSIYNWLASWMATGIQPPNEVVCDYSRALLAAITRVFFKGASTNDYTNYVYNLLIGKEKELPTTYIRLDVAHIIKIFCRIKCMCGIKNRYLKEFYVRGFRLLLTSEDLSSFAIILEALLTIMLSETDGLGLDDVVSPSEKHREFILNLIKGIQDNDENTNDAFDHSESDDTNIDLSDGDNEDNTSNAIGSFLENIKQKSMTNALVKGNRISAYFLPELLPHMIRLCKHFPLWTNILCSVFKSPYKNGSSAAVENDFKELKTQILRFEVLPMTADRFINKHLMNINNNIKLFKSKELRNCNPTKRKLSYSHKIKSNDNIFDFEIETKIGNKESEEVKKNTLPMKIRNLKL